MTSKKTRVGARALVLKTYPSVGGCVRLGTGAFKSPSESNPKMNTRTRMVPRLRHFQCR